MVKILLGVVAAIVIAAVGYFGFESYVQHRVAGEVEAAFEQIRATGAKASHGKVSFDLSKRTLTVADISGESAAQPPVSLKIASFPASGVGQPDPTRFSADSIELAGIEVATAVQAGLQATYKVPLITMKDYSGPTGAPRPPAGSSLIDLYRFAAGQFAGVTASSIKAPNVSGIMKFGAATPGGGEFAYSGLAMEGIKDGKIVSTKTDGFVFTANTQEAGKATKLTGNIGNFAAYDFDVTAAATMLDPQKAGDDQYYRVYRQISGGPYTVTSDQGVSMRIDRFTLDDVAVRPSRVQLPALLAMMPSAGAAPPTPAQAREMIEEAANIYEGMRVKNAEMRALSIETPQGLAQLAATRFNLENGKIGEFSFEGFDARSPKGPIKVGRFALKSLDIANLLRMSAQFSNAAQKPSPDQALALLALLGGAEVKGVVAPYKDSNKLVTIDTIDLNWGQFVGPIPSKAHLAAKLSSPLDATDPNLTPLIAAGIDTAAIDFDLGAAWTEASHTFALDLVTLELDSVLKASARVSLANVPREIFSSNLLQAMTVAAQIEAGPMELAVRDLGGVDLAIAQYARSQNVSREAARRAMIEKIEASAKTETATPEAVTVAEALAHFIENPKGTLIIKLIPLGEVPALQLIQVLKTDPLIALAQFQVQVSTGL
jgi:hypothetical protein